MSKAAFTRVYGPLLAFMTSVVFPVASKADQLASPPTGNRAPAHASSILALQLKLAADMRHALVSRTSFISKVAQFHESSPARFAGMPAGQQAAWVREYLQVVSKQPWTVLESGNMTEEDWYRREAATIAALETDPSFIERISAAENIRPNDLAMLPPEVLARHLRRHATPAQR